MSRAWCLDYVMAKTVDTECLQKKEHVMAAKRADMTVKQALDFRRMAIAKGVSRDQIQRGGNVLSTALDALKRGVRIELIPLIKSPSWGSRIYSIDNVPVRLDQEWQSAIHEAGSNTPSDNVVRQIGHLYPPVGTGVVKANFVLVNLNGEHYQDALVWAKQYGLYLASPRHIFSLAKNHPNLNLELDRDPCYIVAPQEVSFRGDARVCCVWFSGRGREASADWVSGVGGCSDWVAFLRV